MVAESRLKPPPKKQDVRYVRFKQTEIARLFVAIDQIVKVQDGLVKLVRDQVERIARMEERLAEDATYQIEPPLMMPDELMDVRQVGSWSNESSNGSALLGGPLSSAQYRVGPEDWEAMMNRAMGIIGTSDPEYGTSPEESASDPPPDPPSVR